ncbi:MAG: rhomboid family intramembrane serine protease [Hadesarchaea archaeon]|nr:rhomboid family intramembrane serine protease [Hadesarchaea archaeon]
MAKKNRLLKKIMKFSDVHKGWPIVTCVLIGICIMVATIQTLVPEEIWGEYGLVPTTAIPKPWTFVTYVFLHSDINHLMFNLIGLAVFGYYVETVVNRKSLFMVFLLAGLAGAFGILLVGRKAIGASAAIMGLLGFFGVTHPFHPVRFWTLFYHPAILFVILYGIVDFIGLFGPPTGIGLAAHICGLIIGISLGIYWRVKKKRRVNLISY